MKRLRRHPDHWSWLEHLAHPKHYPLRHVVTVLPTAGPLACRACGHHRNQHRLPWAPGLPFGPCRAGHPDHDWRLVNECHCGAYVPMDR